MSSPVRIASLLPETAPFTPEQRIWLDGLFAGLLALDGSITPLSAEDAAALPAKAATAPGPPAVTAPAVVLAAEPAREAAGRSRDHPVEATFLARTRLNKEGSEKETYHVEFDLDGSGLDYAVGDSFGIF